MPLMCGLSKWTEAEEPKAAVKRSRRNPAATCPVASCPDTKKYHSFACAPGFHCSAAITASTDCATTAQSSILNCMNGSGVNPISTLTMWQSGLTGMGEASLSTHTHTNTRAHARTQGAIPNLKTRGSPNEHPSLRCLLPKPWRQVIERKRDPESRCG